MFVPRRRRFGKAGKLAPAERGDCSICATAVLEVELLVPVVSVNNKDGDGLADKEAEEDVSAVPFSDAKEFLR